MNADKLNIITGKVKAILEAAPGCHDWEHTARVLHNAKIIAAHESLKTSVNIIVIEAAAIMHDVARLEELKEHGKVCHATLGAERAEKILRECDFAEKNVIAEITECVKRHRFRGNAEPPETIEQKIIYDADKLDSIGAVGIGRAIHFSGRIGSSLHNTKEEALASEAYGDGDSAYREYLVKLRNIPEKMLTNTGRMMAAERATYMHAFFERLNAEVYGEL
jgi:uncharacterized protein